MNCKRLIELESELGEINTQIRTTQVKVKELVATLQELQDQRDFLEGVIDDCYLP